MTDKAYAVPLHEQLASVPRDARLIIDDANGMGTRFIPVGRMCHEAADALRAALAQHEPEPTRSQKLRDAGYTRRPKGWGKDEEEPEPVACADKYDLDREGHDFWVSRQANVRTGVPLYTALPQREWQGLTDEEYEAMAEKYVTNYFFDTLKYARAIEAKLKEKNT